MSILSVSKKYLFLAIVVVVSLALIVCAVWFAAKKPFIIVKNTETNIHTAVKEILPTAEYASLIYSYQAVVSKKINPKAFLGIGTSKVIFVLDGTIKLGFDCRDIQVEQKEASLLLKMPPVKIVSHEQYPERAEVYDESYGILGRKFSLKEQMDILGDNKLQQEEKVMANAALFEQAKTSAEQLFRPLLEINPSVKDKYKIVFLWQNQ